MVATNTKQTTGMPKLQEQELGFAETGKVHYRERDRIRDLDYGSPWTFGVAFKCDWGLHKIYSVYDTRNSP